MSGRKRISRNIEEDYSAVCFKPCGYEKSELEKVIIFEDEMEAIRLSDLESMYQQECARKMGVSRTTFARLIDVARKKIADALVNQKAIRVQYRDK